MAPEASQPNAREETSAAPVERRQFRGAGATTGARGMPKTESVCGAILARARSEPEKRALESAERSISYDDLEREVWRLAGVLSGAGVRRGSRVALFLDRSIEATIAAIAIMLAGAACVPLDAAAPAERLAAVLEKTGCTVAVGPPLSDDARGGREIAFVDADAPEEGPTPSLPPLESDDAAYVIATAAPDFALVSISHGDMLALLGATRTLFDFSGDERWAFVHSLRSDIGLWEMAACLASGGTGVILAAAVACDAGAVAALLEVDRIAVLNVRPSMFRSVAVAQAKASRTWSALRWLVFTGEPIDRIALRRFRASHGGRARFVNMFGVTEATIFSTFKLLEEPELAGELASPLGFPLAHQEIVLYDESGAPVPAGTAGEMWIRGSGVAAGYIGEPALTKERFVRRATPEGPARFFRTGDLARRRPNGEFEYLGRVVTPREPSGG